MEKIKKYFEEIPKRLENKQSRYKIIHAYTYIVLAVVSGFMTIVNLFTNEIPLAFATGFIAVGCALNLILQSINRSGEKLASILLYFEILISFTFFVVTGFPSGFSIIWCCLIPPMSFLIYRTKPAMIMCIMMLLILIFFLWIPIGNSLLLEEAANNYGCVFRLRFPLLYSASFLLAIVLDALRKITEHQMIKVSEENKYLSFHDYLTGLLNRSGLEEEINNYIQKENPKSAWIAIMDIDYFKHINDTYGHDGGDYLILEYSKLFKDYLRGFNCRYGGDEFAFITFDESFVHEDLLHFKEIVENEEFNYNGQKIKITTSIGAVHVNSESLKDIKNCFLNADRELYFVKNNGKNNIKVSEI